MTTNAGARELTHSAIGFERTTATDKGLTEAVKEQFSPEFRNRIDAIISFNPLSEDIILQVVDKFVAEIADRLRSKNVSLEITPAAKQWLAKKGFDRLYGARPLARLIRDQISKQLSEELLFGSLSKGGRVHIELGKDALSIGLG
jgi:ATP-dependent Clp protease ATP-binding subunit ClpA